MKRTAARIAAFVLACAGFAAAPAPSSAQLCQVFEGVYTGSKELANCGAEVNHTAAVTIELIDDSGLFQLNNSATPTTAPVTATTFAERNNAGNSRYRLYTRPLASIALDGGSASTLTNNFYLVTFKQHFATVTTDVEMTVLRTGLLPELDCEGGINAGTYEAGNDIDGCGFRILTNTPDAAAVTGTIAAPLAFPTRTDLLLIPGPAGASFQAMADATFNVGVHTLTIASLLEGGLLGRQDELPVTVYDYINDFEANFFRNVVSGTVTIGVDYNCTYTEHDANAPTITLVETIEASTVTVINSTAVITVTRQTVRQGIARETNCRTRPVRTYRNVSTVVMSVINGTNVTFTTQVAEKLALPTDRQVTLSIVNQTDLFSFAGGGRTLVSSFVSTLAPGIRVRRDRTYNYHGTRRYSITVAQYSGGARLRDFVMFMELVNQPPLLRDRPETLWTSAYVARSGNTFVLPAPTDHVLFDDIEGTTLSYAASVVSPAGGADWLAGGTRSLSGDPPAAGTYVFDLWASDGTDTAAEAFRFTVTVNNTAPELIAFEMSGRQTLEIREGVDIGGEGVGIGFPSKFTGGVRVIGGDRLPFTVVRDGSAYTLKIKQGPAVVVTGTVVATSTGPVSVDYETNPAYTLTIQALINAQANTYAVGTVTLSVTNVSDEPARIMVSGRALEFNEGYIGVGEYIDTGYRITVTDADAPDFGHEEYSFSVPALTLEGGRLLATGPGALDYEAGHRIVTMVVRDRQAYNAAGDRAAATAVIALSLKAANEGAIRVVKNPPVIEVQDSQTVSFPHTAFAVGEDLKLRNTRFPGNVVVDFSSFSKPYLKVFAFNFGPNIRDRRYTLFYEHKHGTIIVEGPVRVLGTTHALDLPRPSATFRGGPGRLPLTITEPTYLFDRDAVSWHGMGQVIAEGDNLVGTDKDGVTVQIPRGLYNQHLMNVISDDRFEVDYGDLLGAGTEQRFRGIYAKPGAVFDGKPLPITVQVRSGVPPRMFLDEHMLFTLKLSNFLVPNPRNAYSHYPNLRFRSVIQNSKIELTLTLFAPGVAIEGAQAALGAQAGIVDTGLTLVARNYADETRSDELRFVSSSPAIVLPDGYTGQRRVPILMDAGLAAASEALTRDHCGALALPVTLHAEIENVRSNAAVASIRITPGPARLRGRAAATLSAGIAAVTAPTGYELDCLASDVEASFTDSRFTLESGSGATRRIMLKAGATIAAGEGEAVVTVSHRQGGGAQIGQSVLRLPVAATSPELRAGPPYVPGRYYEDDLFMLRLGQLFTGGRGDVSYEVSFTPTVGYKQVAGGVLRASLDYDVPLEGERIIDYNANPIRFVNVTISAWPYVITVVARDQGGGQATASFTLTANAPARHNTSPATRVPRIQFDRAWWFIDPSQFTYSRRHHSYNRARYVIEPGATVRTTTYINKPDGILYHDVGKVMAPFQTKDFTLRILALNPSQGGQVTLSQEFVLGPEQVNDQMVQVLDDRFGVDFTGLSSRIEGNNPVTNTVQWTRGIYVKPGAVFAGPMSLTVLVRAGPDPRNFNAPGLREAVAAAISPSYQISEDNERLLTNYDQAGVSTLVIGIDSQPRLAIVGEQAILDPLSRLTVASGLTLVKSFHTGSLRYSDEGANLVLPGNHLIYHNNFDVRGMYEGDDRTEFPISVNMANARHALRSVGCGMYELPVTINARERVTNGGHRRRASAVFTLTLSGAAGVDGLATVSGTPRRRGPADVAADFATGLAFECAGPGFVFESSNAAFALAGAGARRGIVVRAGTANDDALTTRITYRQGEGSAARSFDLTIGVFSTIAVEGTPGATTGLPQLRVKGTLAGIPGASVTADHHLESGGAGIEYSGVGSFLLRGFTLTTYHEAAGATIYATTAFDAAAYNERLVQVDDDRFGIDFAGYAAAAGRQSFRGLYVKAGAVFTDPLVTITLALNSGAYLKDFATGALGRRIDEGGVKLLDPQVADAGFANTAAAEVALTLRVAPRAFVSGDAVTIETGSGNTSAVTTGLTLHVSYPGNVSIVSVNPAIKLGTEASGAWPISVNRVSIDSTYTVPEGCGISEMPVSLRINGHGAGALGADARFGLRLYDDDVVSTSTRPNFVVGAVPEFLLAGTLTAQMKTGYAINCAHSSFAASFSNSALEIIGSDGEREIAIKDDAVLTTPALTSRVTYQNGSNTNHTVFVTIPVLSTLAWTGATDGNRASIDVDSNAVYAAEFALQPNATITVAQPVVAHYRNIGYVNIDEPLTTDVVVTLLEAAAGATSTARFTIDKDAYNERLHSLSDDRFALVLRRQGGTTSTRHWLQPIYAKAGSAFGDQHVTVTISSRSGSYLDEIEHGGLSAYLANADGTVIFLDPGVPNADFANHSQATASFTVPVLPQVELIGAAPPLLVSSTANDQATGLSLRVRHEASDRLLASWSNAAFTLRNFDITASALGTHGVDVRWHTAGFDGTESCGYKEQTIAFEVNDSVFTDVKVTVTHSITLFSGDSVQTNDKPRLRGSVTIDFLTPGRITVDTPTGLTVGCVGSNFAIVDPAQSEKGFGLDGTGQSPRDLVITTGFTVPDDDSEVVLSLAFANAASPAAADKVTITYTFPIMTTVATSLPDDINYGHRSTLAFSGSTKLSVMEPGVAAARVYLQLPDDSKPDDNLRFKDTEPPLEAGRTFSLTLRSGGVTTAFTIDASVYNDRLLDIQDDRFGYDFANLRKHPSADEYYGEGLYLKAGATLAARKITLHIGSRSGAYISEFEHPALSAYLAANPAAELLNPGVKSVDGDIVNFQVTATSRVGPLILTVAPQLVMTGAPRRLDATTLTGAAPTGVSVRLDWDGTGLLSFSPGAEIGANNAVLLNPRAKGLPRLPGACGEDLVPVTVTVDDRETRAAIFRKQVEFTVTLYDPQAIGGSQVPAIASGPTARLEAGARLDAAVPTGFVFDCAGGGFAASFSNAAFELAGAAPRFEVVIKRGEAVAAGAAGLTTRITYSQGAGTPTYQTDLTVLVGGSIALSPPATLPTVPANQRPAITFTGASTPIDSGVAYAATARLHPGGATYRNMDSFLRQSFDLTVYDLSGSNRTKTTYFEIAAAQYNSRLVQFSDDRFGADARGLYILPGSRFDPAPLTLTLTLNSGSHLGRIGHPALNAFLATANASSIEALDPAVGNGFALTASSVVEVTLRVRPAVALGGTQAALDSTTQTTFVDTGLRLTASYAGAALERTVSPAVFAIGDAGSDGHAISINMGALADAAAQSRTLGCGLYAVEGAASFHPAGDAGAAAATAFSVTLRDAARIRLADRPSIVGFQSIALEAGTLAADFDTGLAFECAAPDFSATFSNPNLVHASTPVNGQLGITLRSGAVIGQGVNLLEVVASARQAASGPEHLFTLTLRVNQSIAIRPPTTLPPVDAADRPQLVTTAAPALIRPNQAYAATTYLYEAAAAPQFRNMNRFQIAPFILTVRDRGSNAERTFTIAADSYNSLLVGLSDSRFGVDFTEVDSGSSQRIRGIYIRPGARFSSEPLTLSLTLGNGAYPIQLQHPELASYLASGSNLQALAPGAQGLTLALTASAVVEIPLRISPDAAAGGVQISIDATRTQGVLDTGLRLQASYGGAALNASASPDIFSLGTPSGGSYPVSMDMSRLAAAPQNYGSCGDFSVPGSAVFAVASDTSLVATVGFSITLYDPRKIRDTEEPEIGGAVTITLEQEAEVGTALPIGLVFDCAGPNFSMSSTPAVFSAVAGAHDAQRQVVLNPITLTADTSAVTAQVVYSQGSGATYTANFTVEVAGPLASIQIHANRLAREVARASSGNMLRSVNKRIDLGVGSGSSLDRAAAEELLRMIGNKERELEEGGANLRELLDGQDFSLGLGANGAAAPGASLWGQANVYSLDRAADDFSYDGALFSGLLGFDYRTNGALFGLVAGHHSGEFTQVEDDDPSVFENDMQTVAPYFAFELGNGGRILALAGAGAGEMAISNEKTEEEYGKVDTNLVFYSMGYSQDLGLENGRMLFKGDFTGNQLSVDGDPELAYDEAENSIWQLRAALEVARGINQGPVRVEPSIEIAARMDIYDDDLGPTERDLGYEAILGLEYDDGGRLFGRVDASLVKLGEHVDSFGLGIGLRFSPGAGQLGLGFDLEPRYGSLTTSGSLYDQDATLEELRTQMGGAAPGLSATSSLRYGIGLPGRVAAPYLTYRLQEENADYVLGIRIHQGGAERWTMSYAPDDDGLMQLRYRIGN